MMAFRFMIVRNSILPIQCLTYIRYEIIIGSSQVYTYIYCIQKIRTTSPVQIFFLRYAEIYSSKDADDAGTRPMRGDEPIMLKIQDKPVTGLAQERGDTMGECSLRLIQIYIIDVYTQCICGRRGIWFIVPEDHKHLQFQYFLYSITLIL